MVGRIGPVSHMYPYVHFTVTEETVVCMISTVFLKYAHVCSLCKHTACYSYRLSGNCSYLKGKFRGPPPGYWTPVGQSSRQNLKTGRRSESRRRINRHAGSRSSVNSDHSRDISLISVIIRHICAIIRHPFDEKIGNWYNFVSHRMAAIRNTNSNL